MIYTYTYVDIPARIAATGSYVPEQIVANPEILGLEKSDGSIQRLLGAVERRAVKEDEACSDIIVKVAQNILESAQVSPLDLDRIIVSATPGDFLAPQTASVVQYKLQARCPAVDINMSCVGWVAGIDYALRCIATGERKILILAGTIVSRGSPFRNPMHRAIFGDGAGGALLEATSQAGCFFAGSLWTDGKYYEMINLPHHASIHPRGIPMDYKGVFYMGPRRVFVDALNSNLSLHIERVLKEGGLTIDEIDVALIHQPSKPLFEAAVRAAGIPKEKIIQDFHQYGNTISAELPISLDANVRSGRIKRGDRLLLVTFGAGFNGGVLIFQY